MNKSKKDSVAYMVINVDKKDNKNKVIKIYLDNLAIEVINDKLVGGY